MNVSTLMSCTGASIANATKFADIIDAAMDEYEINTPARQAAFLAQIGHESGGLRYVCELWGPTQAQVRYEGRSDLGNTEEGDGHRFRGRGLIQITGRDNFTKVSEALGIDFVSTPELLSEPVNAARSAGWFWKSRGLNELADFGDYTRITRRINGGFNGLEERLALWDSAKDALAETRQGDLA